jgi:hypothetical protein
MKITLDTEVEMKDRREDVMSEEEIKLADKYIDWFRSAWHDKDNRGLFDRWELMDRYWEGDVNLPEDDEDPGSNTNIINPNIEGQTALTIEKNVSVLANPIEPSDVPFCEIGQIIGQFIIDQNRMKRKLDIATRRFKKFGEAIFSVFFNPELLEGMGLPWLKSWNPAYVFWDPNVTDVYEIQNGRFVIAVCNKSLYWAKNNPAFDSERAEIIWPSFHPVESEWLYGEDEGEHDEITRDNYMHMFVFTKERKKVRLIQMSGCGVILWDSKDHEIKLPENTYPFFVAPDQPREGTTYAKGGAEHLINTQDLINDLDDQMRINARLTGNIQKIVGTKSGIDIDKWTNEPGLNIPAVDTKEWDMVKPPEMPNYIIQRRNDAIYNERPIISRFSDQLAGIQQRGVDTATEALALHQSGLAGVDRDKMIIEETLSEAIVYALELVKENWTEEQAFRITNKRNTFVWFRASDLKKAPKLKPVDEGFRRKWMDANPDTPVPEYMISTTSEGQPLTKSARFDMKVSIGAGVPNNKAFRYTVTKESYMSGAMSIPEYRQRLREYDILPETSWEQEQAIVAKLEQQKMAAATKGTEEQRPYADIEGLSASGRPAALKNLGGGVLDSVASPDRKGA